MQASEYCTSAGGIYKSRITERFLPIHLYTCSMQHSVGSCSPTTEKERLWELGEPFDLFCLHIYDTHTLSVFSLLLTKQDNFCLKYLTHTERKKVFVHCCVRERDEQMKSVIRELNDLSQPHWRSLYYCIDYTMGESYETDDELTFFFPFLKIHLKFSFIFYYLTCTTIEFQFCVRYWIYRRERDILGRIFS